MYPVWQLWFRNEPVVRTPNAIGKGVRATVLWCDKEWHPVLTLAGQWAITELADDIAWSDIRESINISTAGENAKLLIAAQFDTEITDEEGRDKSPGALTGEYLRALRDGKYVRGHDLEKRITRLKVKLKAENMDEREFRFRLDRDAVDGSLMNVSVIQT